MPKPASELDISVIICTWNRAALLRRTLDRLSSISPPKDLAWEVLIINNNSTDDTEDVVRSFAGRLPIRSVTERIQGLSAARNRGVRESRADLILWTDDDVLVGETWLDSYKTALRDYPHAAFFGGPILPYFDSPPPAWLINCWHHVASAYAVSNFGTEALPLISERLPYGANFAVRHIVQKNFLFDEELGRKGERLVGGEELQVMMDILGAGYEGVWLPKAVVEHIIGPNRQTLRYVRNYYLACGASEIRIRRKRLGNSILFSDDRSILGIPLWLLRQAAGNETQFWLKRWFANPQEWLPRLKNASIQWGMIRELRRIYNSQQHDRSPLQSRPKD